MPGQNLHLKKKKKKRKRTLAGSFFLSFISFCFRFLYRFFILFFLVLMFNVMLRVLHHCRMYGILTSYVIFHKVQMRTRLVCWKRFWRRWALEAVPSPFHLAGAGTAMKQYWKHKTLGARRGHWLWTGYCKAHKREEFCSNLWRRS